MLMCKCYKWLCWNCGIFHARMVSQEKQAPKNTDKLRCYIKMCLKQSSLTYVSNCHIIHRQKCDRPHTNKVVLEPRVSPENTSKYVDTVTVFAKTWTKGHWPLDDLWPHICWGLMCDSTQGSLCPSPMKIHQSMWIQWPFLHKKLERSLTPRWPLTPHLLRSHVCLHPRIIVSKSHENTSKYMDTVALFAKTWTQRSLTPRWPLTPHLLRSHVWLYPRIIVSKSHGNTSKYVDTVINFANYHIHTHTTYYYYVRVLRAESVIT